MVTQEDGSDATVNVNEQTDLISVGNSLNQPAAGLRINGQKYMVVRKFMDGCMGDGLKTMYAKKGGTAGLCLCVSKSCIIIATYNQEKGHSATGCNQAVENLARYLTGAGY